MTHINRAINGSLVEVKTVLAKSFPFGLLEPERILLYFLNIRNKSRGN